MSNQNKQDENDKHFLRMLYAFAESLPLKIAVFNTDASMDYANEQVCDYFQRTREDLVVWGFKENIHPDDRPEYLRRVAEALRTEQHFEMEIRQARTLDGIYRWHLSVADPVRDTTGKVLKWWGMITDIHDQKLAQQELAEKNAQLIHSMKMSALGEMAGGIAHEINNPLAIIHGKSRQLQILAQKNQLTPELVTESAELIQSTVSRISKIVKGLRGLAREDSNDPFEKSNLADLIEVTLSLCREKFRNYFIELKVAPIPEGLFIHERGTQLSQVFLNLLNNAFDAVQQADQKWVSLTFRQPQQDEIEIVVSDSGPGVSAELRSRIMLPFFTTKPTGSGTGLGLSISRTIAETHGGTIYLDEREAHTSFVVRLPIIRQ
jgi:PAS domain S-box-containing protein